MTNLGIKGYCALQITQLRECGCPTLPGAPVVYIEADVSLKITAKVSGEHPGMQFNYYALDFTLDGSPAIEWLGTYAAVELWTPGLNRLSCGEEEDSPNEYGYMILPRVKEGTSTFGGGCHEHERSRYSEVPSDIHLFVTTVPYEGESPDFALLSNKYN
jgi:hypothetical protein